jgi:NAD(P)H-quinone oxidoreductase subunit 5
MHAGIIIAGGALLLRFAPAIVQVPEVLLLLVVIGTLTAALGMLAMWAQTKVKRTLAWSTVSQMGFMMVQCGLGAFPAAALHIVGHGFYKAWSFLRSGELPPAPAAPIAPARALTLALLGTILAVPALMLASWVTGFNPLHSPGELALSAIVALAIGQIWVALLGPQVGDVFRWVRRCLVALVNTVVVALLAFTLYHGATLFLQPVLGDLPVSTDWVAWVTAGIPVLALVGLLVVHAMLPVLGRSPAGRALYVHSLHGFYFGAIADRFVDAVWIRQSTPAAGASHV